MVIARFHLKYEFLSNFYPCPVTYPNYWPDSANAKVVCYPSAEHAYQAAKTTNQEWRIRILNSPTPAAAKSLGRKVPLRRDWDTIKIDVMNSVIRSKFSNENFVRLLLGTGDAILIEGNTWGDDFWGVDLKTGIGQNELGKILMNLRSELK